MAHEPTNSFLITLNILQGESKQSHQIDVRHTIAQIKQQLFPQHIQQGQRVVLVFQGQRLEDPYPANYYPLTNNSFVHCMISQIPEADQYQRPYAEQSSSTLPMTRIDPAFLLIGILGLLFVPLWTLLFLFEDEYFSASSRLMLIVLTTAFLLMAKTCWESTRASQPRTFPIPQQQPSPPEPHQYSYPPPR